MNLLPLCILRTPTSCSSSGNDLLKYGAAAAAAAAVTYRPKRVTVMNLAYCIMIPVVLACCSHFKRILPNVSRRQDKTDDLQRRSMFVFTSKVTSFSLFSGQTINANFIL
jgi:hypothetical protein